MGVTFVQPPTVEPLSLAEAKQHLRVDITDDDALITDLIVAARTMVETITHRQLLTATLRMTLDKFPPFHEPGLSGAWNGGLAFPTDLRAHGRNPFSIEVERPPLQSVLSVAYVAGDGTMQTIDPSQYIVDSYGEPGRIAPAGGCGWPGTKNQPAAVTIIYTAGFAANDQHVKLARMVIRQLIGNWYENREAVASKALGVEVPFAAQSLLDSLCWGDYR